MLPVKIPGLAKNRPILVVEDDRCLETVLLRILHHAFPGQEIDWVSSAEEALLLMFKREKAEMTCPYGLIISDIVLDDKFSGIDFWKICKENWNETPFVITSSMPADSYYRTVGPSGRSPPFLQKPFSLTECCNTLDQALSERGRSES